MENVKNRIKSSKGFTLIELLMVILLVAILAAVAIPQFLNFQKEARDASTNSNLGAMRGAVANQYAQVLVRCGGLAGTWPSAGAIAANDITTDNPPAGCMGVTLPTGNNQFLANGVPVNPWSTPSSAAVLDCTAAVGGCVQNDGLGCDGMTDITTVATGGWCYNPTNGAIWPDTCVNGGAAGSCEDGF